MKKININFTCDKKFNDMPKIGENIRYCSTCNTNVHDFSESMDVKLNAKCGYFDYSQINSFKRNFQFKASKAVTFSLLTLLGITALEHKLTAQDSSIVSHQSGLEADLLIIKGQLINKQTNKPLSIGTVEIYNNNNVIGVTLSDKIGRFEVKIDTLKYELKDLRIAFNSQTDTVSIDYTPEEYIIVEMKVYTPKLNRNLYSITGGYGSDEASKNIIKINSSTTELKGEK